MNILTNVQSMPKGNLNISKISQAQANQKAPKIQNNAQSEVERTDYKPDFFDFLSEKVVNKNDINDMVTVPRAIFKGYLCFTAGTMINTIASFIKNEKLSTPFKIAGCLTSIYGTYNFVKPFLVRKEFLSTNLTKTEK